MIRGEHKCHQQEWRPTSAIVWKRVNRLDGVHLCVHCCVYSLTCCGSRGPCTASPGDWSPWRGMWLTAPVSCTLLCSLRGNRKRGKSSINVWTAHSLRRKPQIIGMSVSVCEREGRGGEMGIIYFYFINLWCVCVNVCIPCWDPTVNIHRAN